MFPRQWSRSSSFIALRVHTKESYALGNEKPQLHLARYPFGTSIEGVSKGLKTFNKNISL
jgi:hypothetical protein